MLFPGTDGIRYRLRLVFRGLGGTSVELRAVVDEVVADFFDLVGVGADRPRTLPA